MMQNLIPSWMRKEADDWPEEAPPPNLVPKVAALPPNPMLPPPFHIGGPAGQNPIEDATAIVTRAAVLVEDFKRQRHADTQEIAQLKVDLAEAVLARQGDQQKINLLELEIAQLQNTVSALQADVLDKDKFMSLIKRVLDKYGIKAPPKPERKPKKATLKPESLLPVTK